MSTTDTNHKAQVHKQLSFQDISHLFAQLDSQSVEQFYQGYQFWSQQQHVKQLNTQIVILQQQIAENAEQMQQAQPSTLALVALAQLQASGVDDLDLLERMLDRGEEWLDHTMQLLELCQQLNVIQGNYTQWCEHALEGAYEWIESMYEASEAAISPAEQNMEPPIEATEELLLQKLMSDSDNQSDSQSAIRVPTLSEETVSIPDTSISPEDNTATDAEELVTSSFPEATEAMLFQKLISDSSIEESSNQTFSDAESVRSASTWYDTYDEEDLLADVTEEMLFQKLVSDPDITPAEVPSEIHPPSSTWSDQDATTLSINPTSTSNFFDQEPTVQEQDVYIPDNIEILDLSVATRVNTENPVEDEPVEQQEAQDLTISDEISDAEFASFPINLPTNKMPALKIQSSTDKELVPDDQAKPEKKI